ncbi:MAG: hypothetical protein PF638_05895 [Candidatus Delongbacteria bacterium]|jgi:alcohol dehydrogenase YqhD (iron-dependent ADH family)|nr:hypothetical protein [Candidatus Delongbacteria bacterium]
MKKMIILILIGKRHASAVSVQEILTKYGCSIKTRLGIHDGVLDQCSEVGLIMIEFVGEGKNDIIEELAAIEQVTAKLVELEL